MRAIKLRSVFFAIFATLAVQLPAEVPWSRMPPGGLAPKITPQFGIELVDASRERES